MAFQEEKKFIFKSKGLSDDTFGVSSFKGVEGISRLYEFEITLVSEDPEVDFKSVLENPATLTMMHDDQELPIHGMVSKFEQLQEVSGSVFYQAILVPKLWQLSLSQDNQLFLNKTVPEAIEDVLKQGGLTSQDYQLKLVKQYPKWEYISQYNESHLNFVCRWMEREGMYYFFEQTQGGAKMVITDSSTAHTDVPGGSTVHYRPPSALTPTEEEVVTALICQQRVLPQKVFLKDYNYRKPSLEIKGEAVVDPKGRGEVYIYGEHFKDSGEGNGLAKVRAEEFRCREKVFYGESTTPVLRSGYFFELQDHYRQSYNQKYLLTEVEHEGSQAGLLLAGLQKETSEKEKDIVYTNRFVAIPSGVQFRPERKAEMPRLNGTMNAKVDSAGSGQYAEIDDKGRYKVILPYDLSGRKGGKASRFVRMAQPYAGADYGMHFPLHKDIEVLLTFIDGDVDRPIISASVPNPETASPITASSHTKSRIRTAAQNEIMMEDQQGAEMIWVSTPFSKSQIFMGARASTDGIRLTTEGHGVFHAKKGIYLNAWPFDYWNTGEASRYMNAGIAAANVIGVAAAAAGGGTLAAIVSILQAAAAVTNIALPGIVLSSPAGISCITPSTFTAVGLAGIGLFTPAVADIVGVASASLMSGGGINIYTIAGGIREVASSGDIKIHAQTADILERAMNNIALTADTQNIVLTAEKQNINLNAHNEIHLMAREHDITVRAVKEDIGFTAKKNIKAATEEEDITLNSKRKVYINAGEEIVLTCGKSSLIMDKEGSVTIGCENILFEAEEDLTVRAQNELSMNGKTFFLLALDGEGEVSARTILHLKGAQTRVGG